MKSFDPFMQKGTANIAVPFLSRYLTTTKGINDIEKHFISLYKIITHIFQKMERQNKSTKNYA